MSPAILEVLSIVTAFAIMIGLSYLRRYGLYHLKTFWQDLTLLIKLRKMNENEHSVLFEFIKEQRVFNAEQRAVNEEQKEFNRTILDEVKDLTRGLYGDKRNGTQGLVQRQEQDEIRIAKLEGFRNKLLWFTSGAIVLGQAGWELFKAKLKI